MMNSDLCRIQGKNKAASCGVGVLGHLQAPTGAAAAPVSVQSPSSEAGLTSTNGCLGTQKSPGESINQSKMMAL